ncbi:hypothetical protein QL285_079824 [Trifolium repens]|nr:hypothetical protein QL285_079824 [Trifolium repens]
MRWSVEKDSSDGEMRVQRKRTRNRSSRSLRRLKALPPSSPPPVKLSAGEVTEAYSTVRFPGTAKKYKLPFTYICILRDSFMWNQQQPENMTNITKWRSLIK